MGELQNEKVNDEKRSFRLGWTLFECKMRFFGSEQNQMRKITMEREQNTFNNHQMQH